MDQIDFFEVPNLMRGNEVMREDKESAWFEDFDDFLEGDTAIAEVGIVCPR